MDPQHDLPRGTGAVHPHCRCCGVSAIRAPFVTCEPPQPMFEFTFVTEHRLDITQEGAARCVVLKDIADASCATDAAKPQAVRPAKAGA